MIIDILSKCMVYKENKNRIETIYEVKVLNGNMRRYNK